VKNKRKKGNVKGKRIRRGLARQPGRPGSWLALDLKSNIQWRKNYNKFQDWVNSRNLKRKNYKTEGDDYSCVLCNLNTGMHISYAIPVPLQCGMLELSGQSLGSWAVLLWHHYKSKKGMSTWLLHGGFSIAAWEIWKQRNAKIFKGTPPSFQSWKANFLSTVKQQMYRLNQDNRIRVQDSISSFI
jgi:hypothetical protein